MNILKDIENWLVSLSGLMPLEVFSFVGAILEEIIAPIPSPLIMATAGTLSFAQDKPLIFLIYLSLIASFGKTIGCLFFYVLADKSEDLILNKIGKFIGFSHKEVESLGKHFNDSWKDNIVLALLRAIPIMPSTPVSIVCGFIKLNIRTFIVSTYIGFFFRNLFFLYVGYVGFSAYHSFLEGLDSIESVMTIAIAAILVFVLAFGYYRRGKGGLHDSLIKLFKK